MSCCNRVLRAGLGRPPFRSRMGMRMKRPHNQMIRQQGRIGTGKAASRAPGSPSYHDGRCREVHIDPATLLVSVVWLAGLRIAPCFIHRLDNGRMRQKFRGGRWAGWRSVHSAWSTAAALAPFRSCSLHELLIVQNGLSPARCQGIGRPTRRPVPPGTDLGLSTQASVCQAFEARSQRRRSPGWADLDIALLPAGQADRPVAPVPWTARQCDRCPRFRSRFETSAGQVIRSWRRWAWCWPRAGWSMMGVNGLFVKPLGRWCKLVCAV